MFLGKKILVPEVIQTSNMDCGPACLKSLADGFGVKLNYESIRTYCNTDVDGTSIDDLSALLESLNFTVKQHISPLDHILQDPKFHFPAIGIIKLPNDMLHFNVFWSSIGDYFQLMDPAHGRYYLTKSQLVNKIYLHKMEVEAKDWYEFACTTEFLNPLSKRIELLTGDKKVAVDSIAKVLATQQIFPLMTLDAAVRFIQDMRRILCLRNDDEARALLAGFWPRINSGDFKLQKVIPAKYWYVIPKEFSDKIEKLQIQGPVFVSVSEKKAGPLTVTSKDQKETIDVTEIPTSPIKELIQTIKKDSPSAIWFLFIAILLGSFALFAEALIYRSILSMNQLFSSPSEKLKILVGLSVLVLFGLLIDFPINSILLRAGRKFDIEFRIAFLNKAKKIKDEYFSNRLSSDILHRIHNIYRLRELPLFTRQIIDNGSEILLLVSGLIILFPQGYVHVLIFSFFQLIIPLLFLNFLSERNLSVQTALGSLQRFNLDALQGADALRSHGAEKALQFEFEQLVAKWKSLQIKYTNANVLCVTIVAFFNATGLCYILYHYLKSKDNYSEAFLFAYWSLNMTNSAKPLMGIVTNFSTYKNMLLRLSEPLRAAEDVVLSKQPQENWDLNPILPPHFSKGVELEFRNFSATKANAILLNDINIKIASGEHIAIIGRSGAGKSTVLGAILGWVKPTSGELLVNRKPLLPQFLKNLYDVTAWVDPDVMLWNRTLLENVRYGQKNRSSSRTEMVLSAPFMLPIIETLPLGTQSKLGEQGAFVSGGEGQRIRFARALNQTNTKLAILDEPFRGLEGGMRKDLLALTRKEWRDATMLCVLHDIRLALTFDRILVIERGVVVEYDTPSNLMTKSSRVRKLFDEEVKVNKKFWTNKHWKHVQLKSREIVELDHSKLDYDLSTSQFGGG